MLEEKNLKDAAAYFGVSTRTIRRWISDGKLSARKIGRTTMVDVDKVPDQGTGGGAIQPLGDADDFGDMMLPQRIERAETERDLAIRRMGQLEHAVSRMTLWRSLAASSLLLCLLLALGLAGGAAWVVQELRIRSAALVAETDKAEKALASYEKAEDRRQRTEETLTQQVTEAHAAVEFEQRERVRLAEELAKAVTHSAATSVLETQTAADARVRIEELERDLEFAQQRIDETESAGETIDLAELSDLLRQAAEQRVAGDPRQLMDDQTEAPQEVAEPEIAGELEPERP